MMEVCAVEDFTDIAQSVHEENIDLYISYMRQVEQEFIASVDELLAELGLSHLKVDTA
jgi:hypothetical protein